MLTLELSEAATTYQDALACFLNDPEDKDVLATFKEARKALDKAKTGGASTSPAIPMLLDTTLACEDGMGLQVAAILMRTKIACDVAKEVILHELPTETLATKRVWQGQSVFCEPGCIWQSTGATHFHVGFAVVDSGASDSVIGVDTFQFVRC